MESQTKNNIYYVKRDHAKTKKELRQPPKIYKKVWGNDMIYTVHEVDRYDNKVSEFIDMPNYCLEEYKNSDISESIDIPKSIEELRPKKSFI